MAIAQGAATVEGLPIGGTAVLTELIDTIEYAFGLGIGMADLPAPAIMWYNEWHRLNPAGGH